MDNAYAAPCHRCNVIVQPHEGEMIRRPGTRGGFNTFHLHCRELTVKEEAEARAEAAKKVLAA